MRNLNQLKISVERKQPMYPVLSCLVLLLIPSVYACAGGIYQINPLSERDLMATYTRILLDSSSQADGEWHDWPVNPNAGYWGDGMSEGNQGIRAISDMVLTYGALMRYSNDMKGYKRKEALKKVSGAICYVVSTHVTGTQKCVDGKQWGNSWQSGMWTGTLAFGAWLVWDKLEPDLQKDLERIVAFEADRFLKIKPPSGRWADTKAEENGWDLTCISVAANMFPFHTHAAAWNEKAIEYMMNVLSVAQDRKDNTLVDGHPVNEWVCTENMHPDFTLENHYILHPSYIQCSSYFLTEAAMHYKFAGKPIPQAATHHLMDTWRMFQTILLPSGETAYPQGQDWELHGLNPINLLASIATLMKDPLAAEMEKTNIQYMRTWQKWCNGSLAVPGSSLGFTRSAIQAEQAAWGYLAHKLFGTAPDEPSVQTPDLVRNYRFVQVVLHNTRSKFISFSWKNRMMGVLVPKGKGNEGNPFFTVPIINGLVGTTELTSDDQKINALDHTWKKMKTGFETTGTLQRNGGLLTQAIKVTSIGENSVVYQDRITATSDVSVTSELGVPIGIENDQVSGGKRTVYYQDGKTIFDWQKTKQTVVIPGSWANVDSRLGVISVSGSGMAYIQANKYNAQGVFADVLYGSFSSQPRQFKSGEMIAHRIMIFFTEITPEQTEVLSRSVKMETAAGIPVLSFILPEGMKTQVPLL